MLSLKRSLVLTAAKVSNDEGFSMRASARGFGEGLTVVRVDKPLKEEAVGRWVWPMGKVRGRCRFVWALACLSNAFELV
jgi:hypothetical protein